jgi:ABC-type phosphate/phosphonate transport system substrate-binding protein/outer membrane protein assembly factor BamB
MTIPSIALLLATIATPPAQPAPLTVVVMDPLAAPLSCPCVQGYAQRDYERLAEFLRKRLDRDVRLLFSEDLRKVMRGRGDRPVDLVIGKQSLVRFDAKACELTVRPLARLAGKDGTTTLTGLFVVARDDPAQRPADLKGYRIIFGPPEAEEKHAAAKQALQQAGIALPERLEVSEACSEAALTILEENDRPDAAVVSSYAMALLEGCGTIDKGDLRVIGRTKPVPFITVFATDAVNDDLADEIEAALMKAGKRQKLLTALESKGGFVAVARGGARTRPTGRDQEASRPSERPIRPSSSSPGKIPVVAWPGFRGPNRDGHAAWLPRQLPSRPAIVWTRRMTGRGLAGIAATTQHVLLADRDATDNNDIFRCLDARTGKQLWQLEYPARGALDYGNSPRATPAIADDHVYLLGAFGDLHCVRLADGSIVWKSNLPRQFAVRPPTWGMCSSPLVMGDRLIVNPGSPDASLVALDRWTGKILWHTAGAPAAYASFMEAELGGRRQIVGYDVFSLGGWDPDTGVRLWRLKPPSRGDFNVPTPVIVHKQVLASSENNGTRLYSFLSQGTVVADPSAWHQDLAPDMSTPIVAAGRVYGGSHGQMFCLDAKDQLRVLWTCEDEIYDDYVSMIAGRDRLLVATADGQLLLYDISADSCQPVSRIRIFARGSEMFAHPALVGDLLYLRDGTTAVCLKLSVGE